MKPDFSNTVDCPSSNGTWHEILIKEDAFLAAEASQTAIAVFFMSATRAAEENSGVITPRFFTLVNEEGISPASIAAFPKNADPATFWPRVAPTGHATGFRNKPCWDQFREDILRLCEAMGLEMQPNHMGEPITTPSDKPSI